MYTGTDNWQNDRETILNSSSLDERIPNQRLILGLQASLEIIRV